jgi:hypothetical protein
METINNVLSWLDKIQGLSAVGLTCAACIAIGYVLKMWNKFPNNLIPVFVIAFGGFALMIIADARPTTMPARIWVFRNLFVGWIIGFVAWQFHYWVLSYIEDYLVKLKPSLNDTAIFRRTKNGSVEEVKQPDKNNEQDKTTT